MSSRAQQIKASVDAEMKLIKDSESRISKAKKLLAPEPKPVPVILIVSITVLLLVTNTLLLFFITDKQISFTTVVNQPAEIVEVPVKTVIQKEPVVNNYHTRETVTKEIIKKVTQELKVNGTEQMTCIGSQDSDKVVCYK